MAVAFGVNKKEVEEALKHLDITVEELAETLKRGHAPAVSLGYWEGLADHVAGIVAVALKKEREQCCKARGT